MVKNSLINTLGQSHLGLGNSSNKTKKAHKSLVIAICEFFFSGCFQLTVAMRGVVYKLTILFRMHFLKTARPRKNRCREKGNRRFSLLLPVTGNPVRRTVYLPACQEETLIFRTDCLSTRRMSSTTWEFRYLLSSMA